MTSLPFRAHVYYNPATLAEQSVVCGSTRSLGCYDDYPNNQCGFTKIGSNNQTWELAASLCHAAGFSVAGVESQAEASAQAIRCCLCSLVHLAECLWLQTWCSNTPTPDCPKLPQSYCNQTCGANQSQT